MLEVGFLFVGSAEYPKVMVESIRRAMPDARITQMTDTTSPAFAVDVVKRADYDGNLMTFRLRHLFEWDHSQALIVDGDVLVQESVEHVFEQPFDIALTKRTGTCIEPGGVNVAEIYPYNTGVMFSRCPEFWKDCYDYLLARPKAWKWWGDQLAVAKIAPKYNVLELPCDEYNWTPETPEELSDAYCIHYKGKDRKEWMNDTAVRWF